MKCSNCGAENPEDKIFCADCGWRLFEPSPRNVEHVVRPRIGLAIISIALGMFTSWFAIGVLMLLFSGGAPIRTNNIPFFYTSIEYLVGWGLTSAVCSLMFYESLTRDATRN